jgi:hypothetical protein
VAEMRNRSTKEILAGKPDAGNTALRTREWDNIKILF